MNRFKYSDAEMDLNKVLKMNQDESESLLKDPEMLKLRAESDKNIAESIELLRSLGKSEEVDELSSQISSQSEYKRLEKRPVVENWNDIVEQANEYCPEPVVLEDFMSEWEINQAFQESDEINREFSQKTSIVNKTDLSFLAIATALQVVKSLVFPYVANKFHYGDKINRATRFDSEDQYLKNSYKEALGKVENDFGKLDRRKRGRWVQILSDTSVPYDKNLGNFGINNISVGRHRMYTLGHDPILGWVFGTLNILTDTITLHNFQSYRAVQGISIPMGVIFQEGYQYVRQDCLSLPASVFKQAQHLKSDAYTRYGLPVPVLSSFDEEFAGKLYKSNYDALCFARDIKVIGGSFVLSKIIDLIISISHGLFRNENEPKDLFEVRTRKILLISNSIASTSTVIAAGITRNPKNLDIGSLLNTVTRLFTDIRFIARIKQEFIESEISNRIQKEIDEADKLFEEI